MNREEMTRIVQSELRHLPRGEVGSPQNELRKLYNSRRRHDIAAEKTRRETLRFCVQTMKVKYPSFTPEYDHDFFGRVEETPKRGLIQRFREWRKDSLSANELLDAIVEERERASSLEGDLMTEREKKSSLEVELGNTKRALAEKEGELERLDDRVRLLKDDLEAALEACLLSYLKEHKGTISIKNCASELNIRESKIKETLDALAKKGKIQVE